MNNLVNPILIVFTFATAFGVLTHDTKIDQATAVAVAAPVVAASMAAIDTVIKSSEHTHVEKFAMRSSVGAFQTDMPRTQPRDDSRRYVVSKKVMVGNDNSSSLWPSV